MEQETEMTKETEMTQTDILTKKFLDGTSTMEEERLLAGLLSEAPRLSDEQQAILLMLDTAPASVPDDTALARGEAEYHAIVSRRRHNRLMWRVGASIGVAAVVALALLLSLPTPENNTAPLLAQTQTSDSSNSSNDNKIGTTPAASDTTTPTTTTQDAELPKVKTPHKPRPATKTADTARPGTSDAATPTVTRYTDTHYDNTPTLASDADTPPDSLYTGFEFTDQTLADATEAEPIPEPQIMTSRLTPTSPTGDLQTHDPYAILVP